MKLTIRKSDKKPDWYVIEPVEPGRIAQWGDAEIEGDSFEMVAIAYAIDNRRQARLARFGRPMVFADIDPVHFVSSPNMGKQDGTATREEALDLSRQIHELLGYAQVPKSPKCETPECTNPALPNAPLCRDCGLNEIAGAFAAFDDARSMARTRGEPGYVGDYAIGSKVWPGVSKLIEEMGELQQVLGKLIAIAGETTHWSGDLRKMLIEELGDVSAAIRFFGTMNMTTEELTFIAIRSDNKLTKFREWQLAPKAPPPPVVIHEGPAAGGVRIESEPSVMATQAPMHPDAVVTEARPRARASTE